MSGKKGKDSAFKYAANKAADARKAMSGMYQAFKRNISALRKKLDAFSKKLEKMEDPKAAQEALEAFAAQTANGLPSPIANQIIQAANEAAGGITNRDSIQRQSNRFSSQLTDIFKNAEEQQDVSAATKQSSEQDDDDEDSDDGKELSGQLSAPPPIPTKLKASTAEGQVTPTNKLAVPPPISTKKLPDGRVTSTNKLAVPPTIPKRPAGYVGPVKKQPLATTSGANKQPTVGPAVGQREAQQAMLNGLRGAGAKDNLKKTTGNTGATAQSPKKEATGRPESMRTALADALKKKRVFLRTNSAESDKTTGSNKSNKSDW